MIWVKQSKYGNKKVTENGETFDSVKEYGRWKELLLLERAGEISGLFRQVKIELIPKTDKFKAISYIADFTYIDKRTGQRVYEDCKGMKTEVYKIKKKLLYWRHGIEIKET